MLDDGHKESGARQPLDNRATSSHAVHIQKESIMNTTNAPMNATKTAFTAPSAPLSHLPAKMTAIPLLAALAVTTVGSLFLGAGSAHADEIRPGLTCDYFYGMTTCANTTDTGYTVNETRDCTDAWNFDNTKTTRVSTFFVPPQSNGLVSSSGCGESSAKSVTYSIAPPPAP
jgi:hypothetical protein